MDTVKTMQQKREWFGGYLAVRREAEDLRERAARLRAEAERMNVRLTGLPGGGVRDDRLQRCAAELADMEREYADKAFRCAVMLRRVERAIEQLKSPFYRLLLRQKYIDGRTWEEIANTCGYTLRHVKRCGYGALQKVRIEDNEK